VDVGEIKQFTIPMMLGSVICAEVRDIIEVFGGIKYFN
jgi:hypothetical protein